MTATTTSSLTSLLILHSLSWHTMAVRHTKISPSPKSVNKTTKRQKHLLKWRLLPTDDEAVIYKIDFQMRQANDLIEALWHHGFYYTSQIWRMVQADSNLVRKFIQQPQQHRTGVGAASGSSGHVKQDVHLEVSLLVRCCIAASFMNAGHLGGITWRKKFKVILWSQGSRQAEHSAWNPSSHIQPHCCKHLE